MKIPVAESLKLLWFQKKQLPFIFYVRLLKLWGAGETKAGVSQNGGGSAKWGGG